MHARLKPFGHRFSYRVMSLLDRPRPAGRGRPHVAAVRRQPRRALQLPRKGSRTARRQLAARLCATRRGRAAASTLRTARSRCSAIRGCSATRSIRSRSTSARDANGELALIIYEVRNTFGEMHHYVLPVAEDERERAADPPAAGQAVLRVPLHRRRHALSFPRLRRLRTRSKSASWRPIARGRCWPPPSTASAAR